MNHVGKQRRAGLWPITKLAIELMVVITILTGVYYETGPLTVVAFAVIYVAIWYVAWVLDRVAGMGKATQDIQAMQLTTVNTLHNRVAKMWLKYISDTNTKRTSTTEEGHGRHDNGA